MGYLSYPRTASVERNIERAQRIDSLIKDILCDFNLSDLMLIEALIHSVYWYLVPWTLRKRVLAAYYYRVGEKLRELASEEALLQQKAATAERREQEAELTTQRERTGLFFGKNYTDMYRNYLESVAIINFTYHIPDTDTRTFITKSYFQAQKTAGMVLESRTPSDFDYKRDNNDHDFTANDDADKGDTSDKISGGNGSSGAANDSIDAKATESEFPSPIGLKATIKPYANFQPDVYILDNGDVIVIDPSAKDDIITLDQAKKIRNAMTDPEQQKALDRAASNNGLVRHNPLKDYVKSSEGGQPRYDLTSIPESVTDIPSVQREITRSVNRPMDSYSKQKKQSFPGCEREHPIPHSCFMERSLKIGESRGSVPIRDDMGNYTEGKGLTVPVYDDQKEGTEHWFLTQAEAQIAYEFQQENREGTQAEWAEKMTQAWTTMLSAGLQRGEGEGYTSQCSPQEAAVVAKCVMGQTLNHNARLGVKLDAALGNGIANIPGSRDLDYTNKSNKPIFP